MALKLRQPDSELLDLLRQDEDRAIEMLFRRYYPFICKVVLRVVCDENLAEDLAQDVFFELWKKRESLLIKTSVKAYLRKAAFNKALNYLRGRKIKWELAEKIPRLESNEPTVHQIMAADQLQKEIDGAINKLPERCRLVFCLSRFEEMSYQAIADELDISVKTVENHISKALKQLKNALGAYL